ncbi:MAG: hypothetical protein ACI4RO_05730 [Candidatus Scatosoma sp.]
MTEKLHKKIYERASLVVREVEKNDVVRTSTGFGRTGDLDALSSEFTDATLQ